MYFACFRVQFPNGLAAIRTAFRLRYNYPIDLCIIRAQRCSRRACTSRTGTVGQNHCCSDC